jgi:carbon-monoxide dehydrogenase medium subunit
MTLPPFELHRPSSLEEATALIDKYGDDAGFYCGGTELVLLLKLGYAQYGHLVNIRAIPELNGLGAENGTLFIGAATTHRQIERSPLVHERWPALAAMESNVANVRVRSAGTLGGNLCFADPHSDPATFLLVTGADLVLRRGAERRVGPIAEFVQGPYQTVLEPGELLAEIRVPAVPEGATIVHRKLSFHERPAATVTCLARVEEGVVREARIAVGSVGVVAVRAYDAEGLLIGMAADMDDKRLDAAGEAAVGVSAAVEDSNGSPEYKRNLVRVLVKRCFAEALNSLPPLV